MPIAMGLMFGAFITKESAMIAGFGMHMLTSILIGVIFGTVTAKVNKLRITSFRKGIVEGLITGMIAFVVLFIPISMAAMPPVLVEMAMQMNPTMTQTQIMSMLQQNMPMMFGMGILEHLVYGAVLGAVTSVFIFKIRIVKKSEEQEKWK